MTDYKELIKQLRYCGDEGKCQSCKFYRETEPCSQNLLGEAADAIEELIEKLSESPTGWTPVSERLPEYGEYVLVTCVLAYDPSDPLTHFVAWHNGEKWVNEGEENIAIEYDSLKVTAWQPLPEPYKEEQQ